MGSYGDALEKGWKVGCVKCHFFDSGSYSLKTRAKEWAVETGNSRWDFFETPEFWKYIDSYAEFVKKYSAAIDYFANVDVIYHPELTYRNQKYLETEHGLRPVPVIHYGAKIDKWLQKYMDEGHDLIGVGGLAEEASQEESMSWIDDVFEYICQTPDRCPKIRIHLFGITTHKMIWRWPTWSIDSTAWTKGAAYGRVSFPRLVNNKWDFKQEPFVVFVSEESPHRKDEWHYLEMGSEKKVILERWLREINIPLGITSPDGTIIQEGIINHHTERRAANLLLLEAIKDALPPYPWPLRKRPKKSKLLID